MEKNPVSIPDELVFDILTRLPVKSLLRFRCVCKRWRSMISDPSFVEAHQCRSPTALLIAFPDMRCTHMKTDIFSVNEGEARRLFGLSHLSISHSVNGLICVYENQPLKPFPCLRVYNLSTRQYVTLPPTNFAKPHFCSQCNSLGFDPSNKTYKILRQWCWEFGASSYEIFTLGSNTWRIIKDGPKALLDPKGICVNGAIYWTNIEIDYPSVPMQNSLTAFDVGEEKFRCIAGPPGASIWTDCRSSMIQIGGHFAIVDYQEGVVKTISDVMTMWKLEDSVNGVWSQKRIVLPECLLSREPYLRVRPLFVTSIDGDEIILIPMGLYRDRYVVHYNLKEESWRKEVLYGLPQDDWNCSPITRREVSEYVESLVSLKEICRV